MRSLVEAASQAKQEVSGPSRDRQSRQRIFAEPSEDECEVAQVQRGDDEQMQPQFRIERRCCGLLIRRHAKTPSRILSEVVGRSPRLRVVPNGSTNHWQRHGSNASRICRTVTSALERRNNRQSHDSWACNDLLNSGGNAQESDSGRVPADAPSSKNLGAEGPDFSMSSRMIN